MLRAACLGAAVFAAVALSYRSGPPGRGGILLAEVATDTGCTAWNVRNTDRAILCARVIDPRTGIGPPGGDVEFVRNDGGLMHGRINRDGTFSLNVPGGRGTLTLEWSCRRSVRWVDTLTVPAGQGTTRTFNVTITPADTLCRRETEDLSDTSPAAVARWISRGPCFAIALGRWKKPLRTRDRPPPRVRLGSAQTAGKRARSSQPLQYESPAGSAWRFGSWRPLQGDSIELWWGEDFSSVALTLGVRADSLAGRGMWANDFVVTDSLGFLDRTVYPNGAASAHAVPCK